MTKYKTEVYSCIKCEGSGIYYRPNGEDDFDPEYCICVEGEIAEKNSAMKILNINWEESEGNVHLTRN